MELPTYFKEFLSNIEPGPSYKSEAHSGHNALRERLKNDEEFKNYHAGDFLQGSYSRNTAVKPIKDVDIVVVVDLDTEKTKPNEAVSILRKCLDKHYKGKVTAQNRSLRVELEYIIMDVVIAVAPNGQAEALLIPDRELGSWEWTHPKKQQEYTSGLNKNSDGYFVPLVKMFKWWRQGNPTIYKRPKGYILECLAGMRFDATARSHARGFVSLLRSVENWYNAYHLLAIVSRSEEPPFIPDPGLPGNNVARRLTSDELEAFMKKVTDSRSTAEQALEEADIEKSAALWRKVFGNEFPEAKSKSEATFEMAAAAITGASFPNKPIRPKQEGFA